LVRAHGRIENNCFGRLDIEWQEDHGRWVHRGNGLSPRLGKRSLVVLFTQVVDDVSARAVVRTVRSLGPRHLPLCVLFRDDAVAEMALSPGYLALPIDTG
jgi:hypothetical protein